MTWEQVELAYERAKARWEACYNALQDVEYQGWTGSRLAYLDLHAELQRATSRTQAALRRLRVLDPPHPCLGTTQVAPRLSEQDFVQSLDPSRRRRWGAEKRLLAPPARRLPVARKPDQPLRVELRDPGPPRGASV